MPVGKSCSCLPSGAPFLLLMSMILSSLTVFFFSLFLLYPPHSHNSFLILTLIPCVYATPLPPLDGHAPPAGLSCAWQGIATGVSRPPTRLSRCLSGCGMVCGFGGMYLRTVPLSVFFLIPTSQPSDMPCSLHRLAFLEFSPNNVTMDTDESNNIHAASPARLGVSLSSPCHALWAFPPAFPVCAVTVYT